MPEYRQLKYSNLPHSFSEAHSPSYNNRQNTVLWCTNENHTFVKQTDFTMMRKRKSHTANLKKTVVK